MQPLFNRVLFLKASKWFVSNLPVVLATLVYLACASYLLIEMWDHGKVFGLSERNLVEIEKDDLLTFSFVLLLMAASGFMMLVTIGASYINYARLNSERAAAWKKSDSQMRAIESCTDGIAILDAEGKYIYVNTAHADCYGFSNKSEMIGKSWRDLYTPRKALWFSAEVFPKLAEHGEWAGRSYGRRVNGEEFLQEVSLRRLDEGGLICIVRDLSKQEKNDQLMKIIKLAVEAASDGIAITDEENRLLFMNRSYLKIHGYDPYDREKYIGTDWRQLYNKVGQDTINSSVLPTAILKGSWSGSMYVMRRDGGLFYGDASITRLNDGLIVGVMRDATDRKRAEQEREELKEQLFQSQKIEAIGRLIGRMAHDFESVLDSVSANARDLAGEGVSAETCKICAVSIEKEARKAREIVEQLTAFIDEKKNRKSDRVNIVNIARQVSEQLPLQNGISIFSDIRIPEWYIHASADQIAQMIRNICQNSFDAISAGHGKIVIGVKDMDRGVFGLRRYMVSDEPIDRMRQASLRYRQGSNGKHFLLCGFIVKDQSYVQLTISDTGEGIPPDILPNIFDPFFTTKTFNKGTGLGLSTVQGVVAGSGGAIIVETAPLHGTSIHLFFPSYDSVQNSVPVLAA